MFHLSKQAANQIIRKMIAKKVKLEETAEIPEKVKEEAVNGGAT